MTFATRESKMDRHYGAVISELISQLLDLELIIECIFETDWVETEFIQSANEDFEQNCKFCGCPNVHVIYEWGEGTSTVNKCAEDSCLNRIRGVACPSNCSVHCRNLILADGIDVNNVPMRVDKYDKGHGVSALEFIKCGKPFMRVTGMVRKFNGEQDIPPIPVAFRITGTSFYVDLTHCGCLARFMRIGSNELRPNAKLVRYNFNGYFHLLLVATEDIAENSEIRLGILEDIVGCGSERIMQRLDKGPSNAKTSEPTNRQDASLVSPATGCLPSHSVAGGLKRKKKRTDSRNLVPQSVLDNVQKEKKRAEENESAARQQESEPNDTINNESENCDNGTGRNGSGDCNPDDDDDGSGGDGNNDGGGGGDDENCDSGDTSGSEPSPPPPAAVVEKAQQPPDPLPSTSKRAGTNRANTTKKQDAPGPQPGSPQAAAKGTSIRCTCDRCASSVKPYDAPDKKALRKHLKTLPNKECPFCDTSTTHQSNLTRHVKLHFASKNAWKCPNPNCGAIRLKKETFKSHIKKEECQSYNNQGKLTGDALEDYCNLNRTLRPTTKNKNGRPDISPILDREWPGSYSAAVRLAREMGYSNHNADGDGENDDDDEDVDGEVEVEDLGYDCSENTDDYEGRGNGEGGAGAGTAVVA